MMAISLLFALAAAAYTETTHLKHKCHFILELLICNIEGPGIFDPDWNQSDATPVLSLCMKALQLLNFPT